MSAIRRKAHGGSKTKKKTTKHRQPAAGASRAGVTRRVGRAGKRTHGRARQPGRKPIVCLAVELRVAVVDGTRNEEKHVERQGLVRAASRTATGQAARLQDRLEVARQVGRGVQVDRLAGLLTAVGHRQRLRILLKLLGGEATHRLLARATGLKAGPLYYHLRELRSARLIGPKVRDLYTLTAKGRRAILAAVAVERLCR